MVLNRIRRNNITGYHSQRVSPIRDKEHDIAAMIEELSIHDRPLSKKQIILLANDMIRGTISTKHK